MISADQAAVSNKKHLNNRFITSPCKSNNILIFHLRTGDFLFFRNLFYTLNQVTIFNGLLICHSLRGFHHLFCQHLNNRLMIASKELQSLMNLLLIIFLSYFSLTWRIALTNMIIKARTAYTNIFWKISMASTNFINLSQKFYSIFYCRCTCIRSKIFGFVFFHQP